MRYAAASFIAAAAVLTPAPAAGDPIAEIAPAPSEGGRNVPGMIYGAVITAPCDGSFPFGRSAKGLTLACATVGEAEDGASLRKWVRSVPLAGVRKAQEICKTEVGFVALSTASEPMLCSPQARGGPPMWTVDPAL